MNRTRGIRVTLLGMVLAMPAVAIEPDPIAGDPETWTYQPYQKNRDQFVLDIPLGWYAIDQAPYTDSGVVAFYSLPLVMRKVEDPLAQKELHEKLMARLADMMSGAAPSFFLDRYKAAKGMSCAGFEDGAQRKKLKTISTSAAFGKGAKTIGQPVVSQTDFAGCKGLKIFVRASGRDGVVRHMLVYTASVDGMTFDFVQLSDAQYFERNRGWFERIMTTVKLTGAR